MPSGASTAAPWSAWASRLLTLRASDLRGLNTLRAEWTAHALASTEPLARLIAHVESVILGTAESPEVLLRDAVASLAGMADEDPASSIESPGPLFDRGHEGRLLDVTQSALAQPWLLAEDVDFSLLADFLAESREGLDRAEGALLLLEREPANSDALNDIFRAFHTIKGTSAFMGLHWIATLAHYSEDLFARLREGTLVFSPSSATVALASADQLRALFAQIEAASGGEVLKEPAGYTAVMQQLEAATRSTESARIEAPPPERSEAPSEEPEIRARGVASGTDESVRVRTGKLDRLLDLVGELVIAQSMVVGLAGRRDRAVSTTANEVGVELSANLQSTNKIVRELQDLSLGLRMVPLRGLFQKASRLARDVSIKSGKTLSFVTNGEDTEIDRSMVDAVNDPLVHMIRNAIDHGIERSEDRELIGKPASGTVTLRAAQEGGAVVITLSDDGRGLDRDRILAKARAKGLVATDAELADHEIYRLIFAPGFSTAEQVTDLSGRGVGMDVVRRNIEAMRGRIEIESQPGQGTTFRLHLPLTLAITDGMLVRVGGETFILPINAIVQSFRPAAEDVTPIVGGGEIICWRHRVYPLVRANRLLDVPGAIEEATEALCVIVSDGEAVAGLLVDELLGQQQVVAKPLSAALGHIHGVSGGAILPNGRVGLILDLSQLLQGLRRGRF